MYLNKVYLIGNLTRDPELKALPSGIKVASFGLATNYVYKNKDGQRQDQTEFHNVVAFGRIGELAAQYLKKGSQALIEGRIQTRSWEQNNEKKYRTEIIADTVQFGNRPTGAGGGAAPAGSSASKSNPIENAAAAPTSSGPSDTIEYPTEEINPDDIPF